MGNTFLSATANFEDFMNVPSGEANPHVLKNNEPSLKKAFAFFQSESNILILCGFAGVGKKQCAEQLLSYMDPNTVALRYVCTESTTVDDVILSLYKILIQKTSVQQAPPNSSINIIRDIVGDVIDNSELSFVPVFFNFDSIKDENRPAVLNYIFSLSKKENLKTMVVTKTFDTDLIPEPLTNVKVMIKALSKEIFETYIREFGIKITTSSLEQFYKVSRGYFLSACLASKIMVNQEYTLNDFLIEYTNSGEKFDDFLAKTYHRLIVGTTKSAFNLFIKLHHGLNLKILQTIGSYPEVIIKTLSDNFYIYRKEDLYYPADFLKMQLEPNMQDEISRKRLASYYEKQLDLPFEERDFCISDVSLKNEINFYKGIEDKQETKTAGTTNPITQGTEKPKETQPAFNFSNMSPLELYKTAKHSFEASNYLMTIQILTFLLDKKDAIQGSNIMYETYDMLAQTYSKLAKWQYALHYYELLERHFENVGDTDKVNSMKFEIANVYYNCYRIIDAIPLLKKLVANTKDNSILCKANLLLGNIALSASNKPMATDHYKEGLKYIDETTDRQTKMELYFKYAILADEKNDINNAIEFYQKCIELNDEKSKYRALAYSNLADLFYDNDLFEEAKECFEKAFVADKMNNNDYGMYYSLSKIIDLTDKKEKDERIKMAENAKLYAKNSKDFNAIIDATIRLGDVYYDYPMPEKALNQYLELYKTNREEFDEYNLKMLKSRLEDIRARLGDEKFEELVPNYEQL